MQAKEKSTDTFGGFKDIDVAILHPSACYVYRIQA